jgi:hypothetical protein
VSALEDELRRLWARYAALDAVQRVASATHILIGERRRGFLHDAAQRSGIWSHPAT